MITQFETEAWASPRAGVFRMVIILFYVPVFNPFLTKFIVCVPHE